MTNRHINRLKIDQETKKRSHTTFSKTNDDTIAADIAGNNADKNDNARVLPSIAFAEKAGRPDPKL